MKKFSKILVALLALALLAGALVLAVSADEAAPTVEGNYVVAGVGYDSWADAVAAADGKTIYLNKDVTFDKSLVISGEGTSVRLNLNGKTVTVEHTGFVFNVHTNASFVLEGAGTFCNVGTGFIGGSSSATIALNGTGSGIVINHKAASANNTNIDTFRVYGESNLTVEGALKVNTVNGSRYLFNLTSTSAAKGAKTLTIKNAKIELPAPTTAGCPVGVMFSIVSDIDVVIEDSDISMTYGRIFNANGKSGRTDVSAFLQGDKTWKDTAASGLALPDFDMSITAKNTKFSSKLNSYTNPVEVAGGFMNINDSKLNAVYTNCVIVAESRAVNASSAGRVTEGTPKVNSHQLTFVDCDITYGGGNSTRGYLFVYGVNFRILGGTVNYPSAMVAGGCEYLEFTNENGDPTGRFVGGYMDNVLLANKAAAAISSNVANTWANVLYVHPNASYKTCSITKLVNGENITYTAGYFTDEEYYNSYLKVDDVDPVEHYIVTRGDGNVEGANYRKDNAAAATGTLNLPMSVGTDKGIVESVTSDLGNGYVKHSYTDASGTISQSASKYINVDTSSAPSYTYATNAIAAASRNFSVYNNYVFEIDVSTDDASFPYLDFSFEGRYYIPRYDANGAQIGAAYVYGPRAGVSLEKSTLTSRMGGTARESVEVSTVKGEWTRITLIIDAKMSETTTMVDYPTYTINGYDKKGAPSAWTENASGTVSLESYSFEGSCCYVYVDGVLLDTVPFVPGYNGYLPVGYEKTFCTDDVRTTPKFYYGTSSVCFDNVRFSAYKRADNIDLELYDEGGEVKSDINGLDHFLIMPDNNKFGQKVEGAIVDGVKYETDAEAIAAIKEGSTVELFSDFETVISRDGVSFTVITNDFNFAGVASSTHKVVDYSGAWGKYMIVPADESEKLELHYKSEAEGVDKLVTVPIGTQIPVFSDVVTAPGAEVPFDGFYHSTVGWSTYDGNTTVSGFYLTTNGTILLYPVYKLDPYFYEITADGETGYFVESGALAFSDNLNAALSEASSVSVILWSDVESNASYAITPGKSLSIDVNGYALIANQGAADYVIYVSPSSSLDIFSSEDGGTLTSESKWFISSRYEPLLPLNAKVTVGNGTDNLEVVLDVLVVYNGVTDASELPNGTYEAGLEYTLNGGAYTLGTALSATGPVLMNASGISYTGAEAGFVNSVGGIDATVTVNVSDSVLYADSASLLWIDDEKSQVFIENTKIKSDIFALAGSGITLGEDCELGFDGRLLEAKGISVASDCVWAFASYDDVLCYIDKPEELSKINWLDSDNTTLIGTTYNVPFGRPTEIYGRDDVSLAFGTDWYDVGFDRWNIPDDFALYVGEFWMVPVCEVRTPSVKCLKVDLVAYTYFNLNFYLPKDVSGAGFEGFELYGIYRSYTPVEGEDLTNNPDCMLIDGSWYKLLESTEASLGDKEYKVYNEWPGASDASENEYKIVFAVGEGEEREILADSFTYGVPTYAKTVMESESFSETDKSLIINMVRYANWCYKLVNDGESAPQYQALLDAYGDKLTDFSSIVFSDKEKNTDTSKLGTYMNGASFVFGSYQPKFVFRYNTSAIGSLVSPDTADGFISAWPNGNRGIFSHIYHENYNGTESNSYIAPHLAYDADGKYVSPDLENGGWNENVTVYATTVNMNVRDVTGVINVALYTPDGTVVRGSYSLASYVLYLESEISTLPDGDMRDQYVSFYEASMSLYAFSLAAQQYDYTVVGK